MVGWFKEDSDTPGRKGNNSPKVGRRDELEANNERGMKMGSECSYLSL